MKICSNCGKELKDTAIFCSECGHSVEETNRRMEISESDIHKNVPSVGQRTEQPMSKKNKLLLLSGVIVIILLFALYKVGEVFTDKDRLIDRLESALLERNNEEIINLLSTEAINLSITQENIGGFLAYLNENPDVESKLIQSLREQSQSFDEQKQPSLDGIDSLLVLKKDEKKKKLFLYDFYSINVKPVYMSLSTNYKDTIVLMDEKEIGKTDEIDEIQTYGPFLPGIYTIEVKLANDFVDLKETKKISLLDNKVDVELYLHGEDVEVYLNNSENFPITSKLFIDGKDTEVDILKNPIFGPVTTDGSMKMKVEIAYPWGKSTTKEQEINGNFIEINNNPFTEEQIDHIMETINQFNNEELSFLATKKTDAFTTITEEYQKEIKDELNGLGNRGYFKGKYLGTNLYLDSIRLIYTEGTWKQLLTITNKYEGKRTLDGKSEVFTDDKNIQLTYDEKNQKWLVSTITYEEYSYMMDGEVKEVENKDPKEIEFGKESESARIKEEMDPMVHTLMENYLDNLIYAINYDAFYAVSPYLKTGSNLYKSQEKLVSHLYGKNITEQLVDLEIVNWNHSGNTYTINTKEKITINYDGDGEAETKDYKWTYTAEYNEDQDELLLTDIQESK